MENIVKGFGDFINEELNFTNFDNGICKLEDRWFFYIPEDDIIYGSDDKPVGDGILFSFNPSTCVFSMNGEEKQYDINNPICLITYDYNDDVKLYTDNILEYLNSIGYKGNEIDVKSQRFRSSILDFFELKEDDFKFLLIYGDQLVASTFDVIEEN